MHPAPGVENHFGPTVMYQTADEDLQVKNLKIEAAQGQPVYRLQMPWIFHLPQSLFLLLTTLLHPVHFLLNNLLLLFFFP